MLKKKQIDFLIHKVKQRVHLYRKLKNRKLRPRWILYNSLKEERNKFNNQISELVNQIKEYQLSHSILINKGKTELSDFRFLSYNGDLLGKVLEKDGHIYRGIYTASCPIFKKLWESGILQILALHGYIPETSITDYFTEDYPIIIEHQKVLISSSKIWNYEMIKDACITISIIQKVCNSLGFKLHDGHLNNVTFHEGRCVFIDIGSFVIDDGLYLGQSIGVLFAGIYRLLFWNLDNSILKRIQVYDEKNNATWISPMYYDIDTLEYKYMRKKFMRYHLFHSSPLYNLIIRKIFYLYDVRPEYISIAFANHNQQIQEKYRDDIEQIVDCIRNNIPDIRSCTDIGGNFGYLAEFLYKEFDFEINALDYQDLSSEIAYLRFKKGNIPINTFLYHYIYGADEESRNCIIADLVTAVDLTHNIEIYQSWKIDSLLNSLSKISKRYICITCYEDTDRNKSLDTVYSSFEKFFNICYERKFNVSNMREAILLLGEKKS